VGTLVLPGALYFGTCSSVAPREAHFEMHLLGAVPPEIQKAEKVLLWVHRFVRGDRTFAEQTALVEQIHRDVKTIEGFFREGDTVCL
jgi:FAD synthase